MFARQMIFIKWRVRVSDCYSLRFVSAPFKCDRFTGQPVRAKAYLSLLLSLTNKLSCFDCNNQHIGLFLTGRFTPRPRDWKYAMQ